MLTELPAFVTDQPDDLSYRYRWKLSAKGAWWRWCILASDERIREVRLSIYLYRGKWRWCVNGSGPPAFSPRSYDTPDAAHEAMWGHIDATDTYWKESA